MSDADPKASPPPEPALAPEPGGHLPGQHRKIVYLMVFRTGLITVLFGVVVVMLLLSERPLRLASRHSQAIFTLIIAAYACSLFYAALFRSIRHKERFYAVQVGVDVVLVSALVHLTGGVSSVYSFLFPLLIVEATIVFYSRGALVTTVAVTLIFVVVAVGGWVRYIPPVAEQPALPWKVSALELAQYLILNLGGQICIAILAAFLAKQLRSADAQVAEQRREISSMEDRVKRAERLAALGRLAAGIAHEIRNPLASVSGSLELLQAAPNATEEDQRLIGIAVREVDRLATLVTNLLEYARPRPLMRMELDLVQLSWEVASACAQDPVFADVDVDITGPAGAEGCVVSVDAAQLRQVLWNLYRNAAEVMTEDRTEDRTEVRTEVRTEDRTEDRTEVTGKHTIEVDVQPSADRDPPGVRVTVTDHGPGIPADNLDHIFEPFFTTKHGGTGLGLAIVHRIVEDHEGTIEVHSPLPDKPGTRISMWLPDHYPDPGLGPGPDPGPNEPTAHQEPTAQQEPAPRDGGDGGAEGDRTPDL